MAVLTVKNPYKDQKADASKSRWARARVDIDYIDVVGNKRTLHYEMDLDQPINDDPEYQIGIGELT